MAEIGDPIRRRVLWPLVEPAPAVDPPRQPKAPKPAERPIEEPVDVSLMVSLLHFYGD